MRQVIDGKTYNTSRAYHIDCWDNGVCGNEIDGPCPEYESESLYMMQRGDLFLYCIGGVGSKYEKINNVTKKRSYGFKIIPLKRCQLKEWTKARGRDFIAICKMIDQLQFA